MGRGLAPQARATRWLSCSRGSAGRATQTIGILLGVLLDWVIADPPRRHPVTLFGKAANRLEQVVYRDTKASGVVYTAVILTAVGVPAFALERLLRRLPLAHTAFVAWATWVALCGTELRRRARDIIKPVENGDFSTARVRLPMLFFGQAPLMRDDDIVQRTVRTVAENTLDAAVAPLLWTAAAGAPGALVYRAINTLDGKVGYLSARYVNFGWASARLDDVVNWVPARFASWVGAITAPVVGGAPQAARFVTKRDAANDLSPNSGQLYGTFSGALGIRIERPHVDPSNPTTFSFGSGAPPVASDARRAVRLSAAMSAVAAIVSLSLRAAYDHIRGEARCS